MFCFFAFGMLGSIVNKQNASACSPFMPSGSNNAQIAYNYLTSQPDLKMTPIGASATVANWSYESGGAKTVNGHQVLDLLTSNPDPNSGADGIAHWLGGRLTALKNHQFQGRDWQDIYLQLDYARSELTGAYKSVLIGLRGFTRPQDLNAATDFFEANYEGSQNTASYPMRRSNAQKIYDLYGQGNQPSPQVDDTACAAALSSGATGDASPAAVKTAADQLDAMRLPYAWGGGHGGTPAVPSADTHGKRGADGKPLIGLDCSGAVSWVLQHAGIKLSTLDSTGFMSWGDPGPGQYVTIYADSEHVFMKIGDRYFGTSGFGHKSKGGGAAWFDPNPPWPGGYFGPFVVRHPPGL
jgi:hypothetical protein